MSATVTKLLIRSILLAASVLTFSIPADAQGTVRDHRQKKSAYSNANQSPPPSVNRPGKATTGKTTNDGGVTVTSRVRPKKKETVCALGVFACTSNESTVKIIKRATGKE